MITYPNFIWNCLIYNHELLRILLKLYYKLKSFALEQFDYGQSSCDESRECNVRRFEMTENKEVWSYLLTIPKPLPNIDVDKLKALGVKQGPWVNEIIKGNDVTLENNRYIIIKIHQKIIKSFY